MFAFSFVFSVGNYSHEMDDRIRKSILRQLFVSPLILRGGNLGFKPPTENRNILEYVGHGNKKRDENRKYESQSITAEMKRIEGNVGLDLEQSWMGN